MTDIEHLKECLRYIADSPPVEHGGFHPETIKTAKLAIRTIKRLEKRCAILHRALVNYGHHAITCPPGYGPCRCGYDKALEL